MKNLKVLSASVALLMGSLVFANVATQSPFQDVTPNDPAYNAVVKYHNQGIFNGVGGEAKLDDVISKEHAALFLLKVMGEKSPNIQIVVDKGILSTIPPSNQLLDHATWIKMLSNGFKVPLGQQKEGQPWFVAPYIVAQSITAVQDEKPFDIASRRFFIRTTELYERIFATKTADELMDEQELRLMKIRDMLVDPKATNDALEDLLWANIMGAEEIPVNGRITAIKHLNMASFILIEMKKDTNTNKKEMRQKRIQFFVDKAIASLPDVAPFTQDLVKISLK